MRHKFQNVSLRISKDLVWPCAVVKDAGGLAEAGRQDSLRFGGAGFGTGFLCDWGASWRRRGVIHHDFFGSSSDRACCSAYAKFAEFGFLGTGELAKRSAKARREPSMSLSLA